MPHLTSKDGGRFCFTMSAKDGSVSFGFEGIYNQVLPGQKISFSLADGRQVEVLFEKLEKGVQLTEVFESEPVHPEEMQRMGWQSILHQFKTYV